MERQVKVKALVGSPFTISLEKQDKIGQGSYAVVVRAFNKDDPTQKLAAKIVQVKDEQAKATIKSEIEVIKKIPHHKNLVNFLRFQLSSQNNCYFIMEYCEGGNLEKYMVRHKYQFSEEDIQNFAKQFCQGYKVLNEVGMIHRDIKPENILIHHGTFKIADFGFAKFVNPAEIQLDINLSSKGTPLYMAPQLYFSKVGSAKVDVFSFGIVLYRMAFKGIHPFYDNSRRFNSVNDYGKFMESCPLKFPNKHTRSKDLVDLIMRMLERDKDKRIDWPEIAKHPFLTASYGNKTTVNNALSTSSSFRKELNVISQSMVKVYKQQPTAIIEEDEVSEVSSVSDFRIPEILQRKDSDVFGKLLKTKNVYTLIDYVCSRLIPMTTNTELTTYLRSLIKKICVAALQFALKSLSQLQDVSGDWSKISTHSIENLQKIFDTDKKSLMSHLSKLSDKTRYLPKQFEQLLHDIFTQYADMKDKMKGELVYCLLMLLDIYDFLTEFKKEEQIAVQSEILFIESLETSEANKMLADSLRRRGLLFQ